MEKRESERKNIKIRTLTPVHIGSGEILQKGFDYLEEDLGENDTYIVVINQRDLFNLLLEKNIDINKFTSALQRKEDVGRFINKFLPGTDVQDYTKRFILISPDQMNRVRELHEQVHDGFGNPFIPGSSLKGAIRTAIFSDIVSNLSKKEDISDYLNKGKVNANKLVEKVFGKTENNLMRFIQVSDAVFEKDRTDAFVMTHLNIRKTQDFDDRSKKSLTEAITKGEESEFVIKISDIKTFPCHSIEEMFALINNNTKKILQNELQFWDKYTDEWDIVSDYDRECKKMLNKVEKNGNKSCILRVGGSNGWKFMTGDYLHSSVKDKNKLKEIINSIRTRKEYYEYPFPKSRSINISENGNGNEGIQLLGFIQLTTED